MVYGFVIIAVVLCSMAFYIRTIAQRIDDASGVKDAYSFAEHIDLLEEPVIVMENNGKKLRFILDSGSNGCHIDKRVLEDLELESSSTESNSSEIATGGGVINSSTEKCTLKLKLRNYRFQVPFNVTDMSAQFDFIKDNEGVLLHGILGANFLSANGWVLDFAENVEYMKDK